MEKETYERCEEAITVLQGEEIAAALGVMAVGMDIIDKFETYLEVIFIQALASNGSGGEGERRLKGEFRELNGRWRLGYLPRWGI